MTVLYVFGGLPGSGKTTLSRRLAADIARPRGPEGYLIAYDVAADNLSIGRDVVADAVNALAVTRQAWANVAASCNAQLVQIEIVCSGTAEHRRRIESRAPETGAPEILEWSAVADREYQPWHGRDYAIDTAGRTIDESYAQLRRALFAGSA